MADTLDVRMIVQAISQGFDKVVTDVAKVDRSYAQTAATIAQNSNKMTASVQGVSSAVQDWQTRQDAALAQMRGQMEFSARMIEQKYQEMQRSNEQFVDSLGKAAIGLGALGAAGAAALVSATKLAGRVETLGVVTVQLGKNVGMTEEQIRDLEQAVKDEGITLQATRQAIALMIQANIDLSNATKLANLAQNAAVIAGINSSEAFERLVYSISSGSIVMLRTMGIQVQFEKAYQDFAKSVGKTTDELTEQERVQARVNIVMAAGTNIAGAYDAAMDTAGKKVTSLDRHLEESKRMLGEIWLPVYADVVDMLTSSLKKWEDLSKESQNAISSMLGIVSASALITGSITGVITVLIKMKETLAALTIATNTFKVSALALTGIIGAITFAITSMAVAIYQGLEAHKQLTAQIESGTEGARDSARSYVEYRMEMERLASSLGLVIDEEGNFLRVTKGRHGAHTVAIKDMKAMTEAEFERVEAMRAAIAASELLANKDKVVIEATKGVTTTTLGFGPAMKRAAEWTAEYVKELEKANQRSVEMRERQAELRIAVAGLEAGISGQLLKAMESYNETMEDLQKAHVELNEDLEVAKRKYGENSEKVADLNDKLAENEERQLQASEAMKEATAQMIYQKAAAGLDASAALDLARAIGVLSEEDYVLGTVMQQLREQYDADKDGLIEVNERAGEYANQIAILTEAMQSLQANDMDITFENVAKAMDAIEAAGLGVLEPEQLGEIVTAAGEVDTSLAEIPNKLDDIEEAAGVSTATVETELSTMDEKLGGSAMKVEELGQAFDATKSVAIQDINEITSAIIAIPDRDVYIRIHEQRIISNIPERQHGGTTLAGMPYLVGEAGPEIFVPMQTGTILPNSFVKGGAAAAGGGVMAGDQYLDITQNFFDEGAAALGMAQVSQIRRQRLNASMGG